jgi:hypothetical protein
LKDTFPKVVFRVENLRTLAIVSGLQERSLDFGVLRRDAVQAGLKWKPLGQIEYALFVPRTLMPGRSSATIQWALGHLPVATQTSDGQFNQWLHELAATFEARLNVMLECETFPHAFRALQTGRFAAILPRLAAADLDPHRFVELASPKFPRRPVALAWNPRTLALRDTAERLCSSLSEVLRF